MADTIPTELNIDSAIKAEANDLFNTLGMDMSGAVNIFLHQCILHGGLPFSVEKPRQSGTLPEDLEDRLAYYEKQIAFIKEAELLNQSMRQYENGDFKDGDTVRRQIREKYGI